MVYRNRKVPFLSDLFTGGVDSLRVNGQKVISVLELLSFNKLDRASTIVPEKGKGNPPPVHPPYSPSQLEIKLTNYLQVFMPTLKPYSRTHDRDATNKLSL